MTKTEAQKRMFKEMARRGGKATLRKHGRAYFRKLAAKRWSKDD